MARFVVLVVATLVGHFSAQVAAGGGRFLATGARGAASLDARQSAENRLRASAARLARAWGWESGASQARKAALLKSARSHLDREIARLEAGGNGTEGALLRRYEPAILVFPLQALQDPGEYAPEEPSVSEMSVYESNGRDNVLRTTRCQGGHCEQKTQHTISQDTDPEATLSNPMSFATDMDVGGGLGPDFEDATWHMANEMRSIEENLGGGFLDSVFGNTLNLGSGFLDGIFGDISKPRNSTDGQSLAEGDNDLWKALGFAADGADATSAGESVSTETVVKEGKMVTVKKVCKNGSCTTTQETRDIEQTPSEASSVQTPWEPSEISSVRAPREPTRQDTLPF